MWSKLKCLFRGHFNVAILERYDKIILLKNFKDKEPEKLKAYQAKCACKTCGKVFIATFME